MKLMTRSAIAGAAIVLASQAMAQITFYEGEGYRGRAFSTDRRVGNFERFSFNDRVGSIVVDRGRWALVRRRQSFEEMTAGEMPAPAWQGGGA